MNPLTAVEFLLCGVAFAQSRFRKQIGALIAVLASIKLVSFIGFDLKLDQMLFKEALDSSTQPNRMAPHTALNFLMMGLTFLFFDTRIRNKLRLSDFIAMPPLLIALTSLVGYLYASAGLTQVGEFIPIAFHTALTFIVLSIAVIVHDRANGLISIFEHQNPAAQVGKKILPLVFLLPVVLGWLRAIAEQRGIVTAQHGVALMALAWSILGTLGLWFAIRAINDREQMVQDTLKRESDGKLNRLKRFFPPTIAEMIVSGEIEDPFKWRRTDITVIFIDIRGFTPFSEQGEPEEVMGMLQTYYSTVAKIAQKYHGTIGHLAGDGVMIFFNAPIEVENPQKKAVEMALEVRQELAEIWKKYRFDDLELDFGAGIASGFTTIGGIGAEGFWDYTVIGTPTNVAARLCSAAKEGQILVSRRFLSSIEDSAHAEPVGTLELKGIQRPVNAFNITGVKDAAVGIA